MGNLFDEMWTVMRAHIVCAIVFRFIYGWTAMGVVIAVGLAWCVVLAIIPARKARAWTPRR